MTRPGAHPADLFPSLWILRQRRAGRHRVIRAIAASALTICTRPGQTMIVASADPALRRALHDEAIRAGRCPIPAAGDGVTGSDHAASTAGHGALLLAVASHQHPSPGSGTTDGVPLVNDAWVGWLRQTLLDCRRLLRPGAPVVTVTRPTRHHGQLLDLPGAVITAGHAAGLIPLQRCAAVTLSARGTPVPLRSGRTEYGIRGSGIRRQPGYPTSRAAHHDIVVFQNPPALTETAAVATTPPARAGQLPGIPFEPYILERPAA